jgi:hypothetical protein
MADAELVSELVVSMLDGIRQTKAKDLNEFYSLFCATYDAKFGLPASNRPHISFTAKQIKDLAAKLHELDELPQVRDTHPGQGAAGHPHRSVLQSGVLTFDAETNHPLNWRKSDA